MSAIEKEGFKRLQENINNGDIRVVTTDKGGALSIVNKAYITAIETEKLRFMYDTLNL